MLEARGQPTTTGGEQSGRGAAVHVKTGWAGWRGRVRGQARAAVVVLAVVLGRGGDGPRPQSEHQASGAASVGRRDRATCAGGLWTTGAGAGHHALRRPKGEREQEEQRSEGGEQVLGRAGAAGAVVAGGAQDASVEEARAGGGSGASKGAPTDRQRWERGRRRGGRGQQRSRWQQLLQQQSASPAWERLSARPRIARHVAGA